MACSRGISCWRRKELPISIPVAGVLRSHADADQFRRRDITNSWNGTTMTGQMLFASGLRTAENERKDQFDAQSLVYHLQLVHCPCVSICRGTDRNFAGLRHHHPVGSSVLHQPGRGRYRSGCAPSGDAEIVLLPWPMVLLGQMPNKGRQQQRSPVTRLPATYRKGTPQSPSSPAALLDNLVWASASGLWENAALLDDPFEQPFPTGRLKSVRNLGQPCLGICSRL